MENWEQNQNQEGTMALSRGTAQKWEARSVGLTQMPLPQTLGCTCISDDM